jgi:hypothetical protein
MEGFSCESEQDLDDLVIALMQRRHEKNHEKNLGFARYENTRFGWSYSYIHS